MNADPAPEPVEFITTQYGDDLIVSFAITADAPCGIVSLTLLRTPKYEFFLPADERGVHVSHESLPEEEGFECLQRIRLAPPVVTIATNYRRYELDVSAVDHSELETARRVLERMNFDSDFLLESRIG